jgi:hypothetical protein
VSGACVGGDRDGQPCVVQGTSAAYGEDVSLDCPPSAPDATTLTFALTLTTGTQNLTLGATSPSCSGPGTAGMLCQCDTCDNAAATPCHTHADCLAVGATTCGGRRCIGSANSGTPCVTNSECPGGACTRLGVRTQPNDCNDLTCSADVGDTASSDEGFCAAGPFLGHCTIRRFQACGMDTDCTTPGDHCTGQFLDCFTDNGVLGGSITASGSAADAPTVAGLACVGPLHPGSFYDAIGLPGPARFTLRAQGILQ